MHAEGNTHHGEGGLLDDSVASCIEQVTQVKLTFFLVSEAFNQHVKSISSNIAKDVSDRKLFQLFYLEEQKHNFKIHRIRLIICREKQVDGERQLKGRHRKRDQQNR